MEGGKIIYFEKPGPQNTEAVIQAVEERLKDSKIRYVVVASESGKTALKVARALKNLNVKIVCISGYAGIRKTEGRPWPDIRGKLKEELDNLNVKVLDETPWIFRSSAIDHHFLGEAASSTIMHKVLSRLMGYGFKTAIEITLLAAEAGAIPTDEEVIAITGTGWLGGGADCAIIVRPSVLPDAWFMDVERGIEVREIIAMPRVKFSEELIKLLRERVNQHF
ncbi:MAG: pyruvate kinase alpha/beta domain-containing protein [Candidatus Bathyarchaeia archaeon]